MQDSENFSQPVDQLIADLTERQKATTPPGETNYRVDAQRLGFGGDYPDHQDPPHAMYFYYVRVNGNGTLHVTHHFYPGGKHDDPKNPANPADWPELPRDEAGLTDLLRRLALDARPSGAGQYPPIGRNFRDITWRRKSYIAIFIDEVSWKLHRLDGAPSLVFLTQGKWGRPVTPNHSFFDAKELTIQMPIHEPDPGDPTHDFRSAIVFVNHMKADAEGRDLDVLPDGTGESQRFEFNIVFRVMYTNNTDGMIVIFDPDGNNLGPPVPPP